MNFRPCGDCTICCSGALVGEANGHQFGQGKKCHYLVQEKCTIYNDRPETCRKYFCAWSQGIFPEWMKPNQCGVMVSVEGQYPNQYLKVVELSPTIDPAVYKEVQDFCDRQNTHYVRVPYMNNNPQQVQPSALETFTTLFDRLKRRDLSLEMLHVLYNNSNSFIQYQEIAKCYYNLNDYDGIVKATTKAIELVPDEASKASLRENLISTFNKFNEPELALKAIEENEKFGITCDLLMSKQFALFLLNRKDEAEKVLYQALSLPNLTEQQLTSLKFNTGSYHFRNDRFREGLQAFIVEGGKLNFWKTNNSQFFKDKGSFSGIQEWKGEYVEGGTVILHAEAGIGDEIVNIRFSKHIKDMGMTPLWYSDSAGREDLKKIFTRSGFTLIDNLKEVKGIKNLRWIHSMHLPLVLGCEYKDLWYGPYIKPDTEYIKKWEEMTRTHKKLKIGIRWQGAPHYEQDLHRTIPLGDIYNAIGHLDAAFYSLQKDDGVDDTSQFPGLYDLSKDLECWDDTLGVMHNMDFIITSCTSIPHMALASGVKTYVLPPIATYYTWSNKQDVNPWYGENATVIPQEVNKSWKEPLDKLKNLLK